MNIFASTAYRYAEEDRLTNALISLLEHSDRRVLDEFLRLVLPDSLDVPSELEEAAFDVQITLRESRPDAYIGLPSIDLFIETKRGKELSDDQFLRHLGGIDDSRSNTALLALTRSLHEPELLGEIRRDNQTANVNVCHVSWSVILEMLEGLAPEFDAKTKTHFLIDQFAEYLQHLGYYCFKGLSVDELTDYGECLMKIARHEQTTVKELRRLLRTLGEEVAHSSGLNLDWSIQRFGTSDKDVERTNFDFLTSPVPAFGHPKNPRFRILPSLRADGSLRVKYYFTYSNFGDLPWSRIVKYLRDRRAMLEERIGPLHVFGQVNPDKLFHIAMLVAEDAIEPLIQGDPGVLREVGQTIGAYFAALDETLKDVIEAATTDAQQVLS